MKKICYSLFGLKEKTPENAFEYFAYFRGLVWNVKMNKLLLPDWTTHIEVDVHTYSAFDHIFYGLRDHYGCTFGFNQPETLCKSMLWRMKPLFEEGVEKILCRDADAITTHREACCIDEWEKSQLPVHVIADNVAHMAGIMGGMCGFKSEFIKKTFGWNSWEEMLSGYPDDFALRGSDQGFLNKIIYPSVKNETFAHYFCGVKGNGEAVVTDIVRGAPANVDAKYWESDLTTRHIGSAGVIDLETIRFFKRFNLENAAFIEIEKKYPDIFYWHHR